MIEWTDHLCSSKEQSRGYWTVSFHPQCNDINGIKQDRRRIKEQNSCWVNTHTENICRHVIFIRRCDICIIILSVIVCGDDSPEQRINLWRKRLTEMFKLCRLGANSSQNKITQQSFYVDLHVKIRQIVRRNTAQRKTKWRIHLDLDLGRFLSFITVYPNNK